MIISSKRKILIYSNSILLASTLLFASCKTNYVNHEIEAKNIRVDQQISEKSEVLDFINPYKQHVDNQMSQVLSYSSVTMDRTQGKWETTIGNLFAEAVVQEANPIFKSRAGKNIDICLLNYGGVRAVISKGDVTTRTAYEIMPFENAAVVLEMKGDLIQEMAEFFIKDKKAHPLAGLFITIDSNQNIKSIHVGNELLDLSKTYYVVTNDYLSLGGDNMKFFTKAQSVVDLDYKLRNVLLDYFKKTKELPNITTKHVIEE